MDLKKIIRNIGETGKIIYEKNCAEGSAGNISVYFSTDDLDYIYENFSEEINIDLPYKCPNLIGGYVIITGSGTRLRELYDYPFENLAVVKILSEGKGKMYVSPNRNFQKNTVEFNSHLAMHNLCVDPKVNNYHSVVHAQPLYLTHLSHHSEYADLKLLNKAVLRWEIETIVNMPNGIGYVPFAQPGSNFLMKSTEKLCLKHNIILWGKHGVIARSHECVKKAWDLIEYAETGAMHEFLNILCHNKACGISNDKIKEVMNNLNIKQTIF